MTFDELAQSIEALCAPVGPGPDITRRMAVQVAALSLALELERMVPGTFQSPRMLEFLKDALRL